MAGTEFVVDLSNEQILIAAVMRNYRAGAAFVTAIPSDTFLDDGHRRIWDLFRAMTVRAQFYSRSAMLRFAQDAQISEKTIEYLVQIEDYDREIPDLRQVVQDLHWDSTRYAIYKELIPELMQAVLSIQANADDIVAVTTKINQAIATRTGGLVRNAADVHLAHNRELMRRMGSEHAVAGIGIPEYDALIGTGYSRKKTSVVAATSSTGKSTYAYNLIRLLVMQGRKPGVFLWEPETNDVLDILLAIHCEIELDRIQSGRYSQEEQRRLQQASAYWSEQVKWLGNPKTFLENKNPKKPPTNAQVLDLVAATISSSGADFILYDLWDRGIPQRNTVQMVEDAFVRTMDMHKNLDVHGMVLHQINMEKVEGGKKPRRPRRDDIKGAKIVVEAPDFVSLLYRPGLGGECADETIEQDVQKLRGGRWPVTVTWDWNGAMATISKPRVEGDGRPKGEFDVEDLA